MHTLDASAMQELWQPFDVPDPVPRRVQVGPLELWLCRTARDFHVASRPAVGAEHDAAPPEAAEAPPDLDWQRFLLGSVPTTVRLVPVLPDRPVIVRPEHEFQIVSGAEVGFFVLIPCSVKVVVGGDPGTELLTVPSLVLSNSWLGDTFRGELCYAMRTRARQTLDELGARPHRAVCHVRIRNTSSTHLPFHSVCLRVDPMTLYWGGDYLWTNDLAMRYLGNEQFTDLEYRRGAPAERPQATLLAPPRVPEHDWVQGRIIRNIRSFL